MKQSPYEANCLSHSHEIICLLRNSTHHFLFSTQSLHPLITISFEQTPSWEDNSFSAGQEIPTFLRNPNIHCCVSKSPPFVLTWIPVHSAPRIVIKESCSSLLTNSLHPSNRYKLQAIVCLCTLYLTFLLFLGVFAKLRKVTVSLVMSFCPSIRPHGTTGSHWRIFVKFGIRESSEYMPGKFRSH